MNNRIHNSSNPDQGSYKKVLCVCSAGLLRSPTMALVLSSEPFNFNTRAAGLDANYALVCVDDVLLHWADEIVVAEVEQRDVLEQRLENLGIDTRIFNLNLSDCYNYRDPQLMELVKSRYNSHL